MSTHDTSSGESVGRRRKVLRVVRGSSAPMSIVAIAEVLDVHPNTVRFHLESLVGDGQVEQVEPERKGPGRPPLMFRAVRQMDRGGTRHYRLLAEVLAAAVAAEPDPGATARAAGLAWARRTEAQPSSAEAPATAAEAIEHLVDMLDDLGFAPEHRVSEGRHQLGLRHCPFLELAENRTSVICQVHLGLMRGTVENLGAPLSVDSLEPFAEPDLCLAHLTLLQPAP